MRDGLQQPRSVNLDALWGRWNEDALPASSTTETSARPGPGSAGGRGSGGSGLGSAVVSGAGEHDCFGLLQLGRGGARRMCSTLTFAQIPRCCQGEKLAIVAIA